MTAETRPHLLQSADPDVRRLRVEELVAGSLRLEGLDVSAEDLRRAAGPQEHPQRPDRP